MLHVCLYLSLSVSGSTMHGIAVRHEKAARGAPRLKSIFFVYLLLACLWLPSISAASSPFTFFLLHELSILQVPRQAILL